MPRQLAVSETAVPTIHRLEQVSSEEKVGSLAENLMEALKEHRDAKAKVNLNIHCVAEYLYYILLKRLCRIVEQCYATDFLQLSKHVQ